MTDGETTRDRATTRYAATTGEGRVETEPASLRPARLVAGAACCVSGAALVVHILTRSPLVARLCRARVRGLAGRGRGRGPGQTAGDPAARSRLGVLAKRGVVVGLVGTAAYDASRWILVQLGGMHLSPFEALPLFGQALLGESREGLAVTAAGVAYHILNGVAFGVAYTIWFGRRRWWWGIVFALGLEAFMLALYPGWLNPRSIAELTQVSMVGHFAYGATLGLTATKLLAGIERPADANRAGAEAMNSG